MAYKNLEITAVNGYTNQDFYAIFIPENIQTGTVVGKVTGWVNGEDLSQVIFAPNTAPGSPADDQGRFEIVMAAVADPNGQWAAGDWIVVIKSGEYPDGSPKFNWEDQSAFANELNFNVTFQAGYTPQSTYGCDYIFNVENINEAPTNVAISADTVTENAAGVVVGDLSAYDDDDFYWVSQSIVNYSIVPGLDGAHFQITAAGELQAVGALDYEASDIHIETSTGKRYYDVIVRASDTGEWGPNGESPSGTPAYSDKTFRVYVNDDPSDNSPTNAPPPAPTGTASVNEGTVGSVTVLTLAATDTDGQTITYTFQSGGTTSADGKFKIVGNTIQTNGTLANETANHPYTYAVVADDGSGSANATATGNVTITVNDVNAAPPAPTGTASVNEGTAGSMTVLTLPATDTDGQTITYTFQSGGTTSADGKFKIVGNTIQTNGTLANETANHPYTYAVVADDGSGSANATATGNVTITVNDVPPVPPAVSINDVTVTEGNGGAGSPTLVTFTVTRTGDTAGPSTVDWALAHGNTTAGDFVVDAAHPLSGVVSFGAGEISQTIVLQVNGDTSFEPNETFSINLSNANNATISDATGAGTITNDDVASTPVVQFSSPAPTVTQAEGDSGTVTYTYFVIRDTMSGDSTVNWAVTGSGANPADGADFGGALPSGQVTFLNGQNVQSFNVSVSGDTAFEPSEQFTVTLSAGANATVNANNVATGTITNDDVAPVPPALSINDMTVTEGNGGTGSPTLMTFTVTRTGDTAGPSTVDWALAHGTTAASDFVVDGTHPLSGTLSFAAGQTSRTIVLQVDGDTAFEPNETFSINLSNAANATISDGTGAGTITNDDVAPPVPVFSIAATDAVKAEGDSGYTEFTFTITRSGDPSVAASINWAVQGTGTNPTTPADYIAGFMNGTEAFAANEVSRVITVRVAGDTAIEPDETFSVVLSAPTNGATVSTTAGSADGTILDDDEHAPTFVVDPNQNYFSGSTGAAIAGVLAGVDLNDLDGDQLTLTVSFLDANGALSGMTTGGNVTVTDDGTNPQSGIHQYTLVGSAAHLEAFLAQRSFTPAIAGENTKFSFTLTDLHHAPAAYGDQITVLGEFPGNHAPVPPSASVIVHEGKGPNFEVASFAEFDDEGTTIGYTFFGAQANSNGKISGDGRFQIVGNKVVALDLSVGADTQATYVVEASDGTYTVDGTLTVSIKNNQAPTIGSVTAAGSGRAGNAGTILVNDTAGAVQIAAVTASDPDAAQDGRTLTYALADTYNGLFAIDPDGKVRIADASKLPVNTDTPYQLTIQVSDGSDTTTQAVTVTVVNVPDPNHAPGDLKLNVTHAPNEYEASGTVVGALSASDGDSDALSYALVDNAGGRFKLVGNQLVVDNGFLFDFEQATSHKVTVQVSDGHGGVATEVFTIGVTDVNPEITGGTPGNDVFYGGGARDKLYGGAGNDRLFGGANVDIVKGYAGNDTIGGGAGKDKLFGGKGKFSHDMFVFDTKLTSARVAKKNVDKIYDFGPKYDSLGFDDLAFSNRTIAKYVKKKGGATLDHQLKIDKHWFRVGDKALDKNDFFIYNATTHKIYFDVDGSGHKAMVEVASFGHFEKKAGLTLTFKDFFLI